MHSLTSFTQKAKIFILALNTLCMLVSSTVVPNWQNRLSSHYDQIPCKTEGDCMHLGKCMENGQCQCSPGFMGSHCHELDLLPIDEKWGFNDANYPSWGGN